MTHEERLSDDEIEALEIWFAHASGTFGGVTDALRRLVASARREQEAVALLRTVKCCAPDAGLSACRTLVAIQRWLRTYDAPEPGEAKKEGT